MKIRTPKSTEKRLGNVDLGVPVEVDGEFYLPCTDMKCRFYVNLLSGVVEVLSEEQGVRPFPNAVLMPEGNEHG